MRQSKPSLKAKKKTIESAASRLGSAYDKMIKENFEKSLKTIIRNLGGVEIVKSEPLRTKMQHTKERDPDELSKVWLASGEEKILHAEVHLKDENDVNLRVCEYYVMLKRKDPKLPIVQFVIFIGSEDPKYITGNFQTDVLSFQYNVIVLKNIPYQIFLEADNPETVVFSILANFQGEDPAIIGQKITDRLKKLAKTDSEKEKYFTQLRVLSNIRKLQPTIDKIMANIFKLIDISEDPLYVEGKLEGKLEGKYEGVKSLTINSDFDDEKIAFIMAVTVEYVAKIRAEIAELTKKK